MYHIANLLHKYNAATILDIPACRFDAGQIYCLYGANGAGKTTLFEILTLLQKPTAGTILFDGQEIFPGDAGRANLRAAVTLVSQHPLLFDTTVARNVDYGLRVRRINKTIRQQRVRECLQFVGLDGFEARRAKQLSGGEIQRVAIARALALHPRVLFLDEFSANVDQTHRAVLETLIQKIRAEFGITVIFTTHYVEQAYRLADHVLHLFRGRLVAAPLKNIFHGTIRLLNDHAEFTTGQVTFEVVAARAGQVSVAIAPQSLVIATHPLESSMRNCVQGIITHLIDAGNQLDLKIHAGESFEATITKESFFTLGLHPGMPVYVYFKASAVEVF